MNIINIRLNMADGLGSRYACYFHIEFYVRMFKYDEINLTNKLLGQGRQMYSNGFQKNLVLWWSNLFPWWISPLILWNNLSVTWALPATPVCCAKPFRSGQPLRQKMVTTEVDWLKQDKVSTLRVFYPLFLSQTN